jgi:phosphomannomutase
MGLAPTGTRADSRPDGLFPSRGSNPLEEGALGILAQTVTRHNLDFRLASDGDAGGAVDLDSQAHPARPPAVRGLSALHHLTDRPGKTILHHPWASRPLRAAIEEPEMESLLSRPNHLVERHRGASD